MKAIYLFTLLAFGKADDGHIVVSEECMNQMDANDKVTDQCSVNQYRTSEYIFNRFKSLVLNYNHSDENFANLIEFGDQNCEYLLETFQCFKAKLSFTAECPSVFQKQIDINHLVHSWEEMMANYLCADNFNVTRKLIANDGLKFFLDNENFYKCFENEDNNRLCPAIDFAASCVLQLAADHPNEYVKRVVLDMKEGSIKIANCSNDKIENLGTDGDGTVRVDDPRDESSLF